MNCSLVICNQENKIQQNLQKRVIRMSRNLQTIYPLIQYNIEKSWRTQDFRNYLLEHNSGLQISGAVSSERRIRTNKWKL